MKALDASYQSGEIPIVAYPPEVFFGQLTNRAIFPALKARSFLKIKAETALTLAAARLASEGVGVGWVPEAVASRDVARGDLLDLRHSLQSSELSLAAVRIAGRQSTVVNDVWKVFSESDAADSGAIRTP